MIQCPHTHRRAPPRRWRDPRRTSGAACPPYAYLRAQKHHGRPAAKRLERCMCADTAFSSSRFHPPEPMIRPWCPRTRPWEASTQGSGASCHRDRMALTGANSLYRPQAIQEKTPSLYMLGRSSRPIAVHVHTCPSRTDHTRPLTLWAYAHRNLTVSTSTSLSERRSRCHMTRAQKQHTRDTRTEHGSRLSHTSPTQEAFARRSGDQQITFEHEATAEKLCAIRACARPR